MTAHSIVLGLWPIAGVTTVGVTREQARLTIRAAIDAGLRAFDTAYSYGYDGESDRLLGEFLTGQRDEFHVMGKVGQRWTADRKRYVDGSPEQLRSDAEESLRRLKIDSFDVLFLHSPDPKVPIEESAAALAEMMRQGRCRSLGISNATPDQVRAFHEVAPLRAFQCPLNLVQPNVSLIESSRDLELEAYVFWTLMKGLLAGRIERDHTFPEGDSRPSYPIFQGRLRAAIHDLIDEMKLLGEQTSKTVAQLSVGWAISQSGVRAGLVGARRPEQIRELAASKPLAPEIVEQLNQMAMRSVELAAQVN